ncbi:TPA: MFS transporter [Legionella pneumophila]|nr:MFS transporter [Legionella pneumophila]HDV5806620.1 MFS transporter [Legionella pneumophila]
MPKIITTFLFFIYGISNYCPTVVLPLYPTIADSLHVNQAELRSTMGYLTAGIFLSQLILLVRIQSIGYRNAYILLFTILCLGSFISLISNSISTFFLGTFLQGLGYGAASPLSQGLGKIYLKDKIGNVLSYASVVSILIIFLAPIIGAQFEHSWNYVFFTILIPAIFIFILSFFIPYNTRSSNKVKFTRQIYILLENKNYLKSLIINSTFIIGYYAFLTESVILLLRDFHITSHQFAYLMAIPTLAKLIGNLASTLFRHRHNFALFIGGLTCTIAGLILISFFILKVFLIWIILLAGALYYAASGLLDIQCQVVMLSAVEDYLSGLSMLFKGVIINMITAISLFILSKVTLNDWLLLATVFVLCGISCLLLLFFRASSS